MSTIERWTEDTVELMAQAVDEVMRERLDDLVTEATEPWIRMIKRAGLEVSFCPYCGMVALAAKRTLCCGESRYDAELTAAPFRSALEATT